MSLEFPFLGGMSHLFYTLTAKLISRWRHLETPATTSGRTVQNRNGDGQWNLGGNVLRMGSARCPARDDLLDADAL